MYVKAYYRNMTLDAMGTEKLMEMWNKWESRGWKHANQANDRLAEIAFACADKINTELRKRGF